MATKDKKKAQVKKAEQKPELSPEAKLAVEEGERIRAELSGGSGEKKDAEAADKEQSTSDADKKEKKHNEEIRKASEETVNKLDKK